MAPRKKYTLKDKYDILSLLESSDRNKVITDLNINRFLVYKILRDKQQIRANYLEERKKFKKQPTFTRPDVDAALITWFSTVVKSKVELTARLLQGKANEIAKSIDINKNSQWTCTPSWIQKFCKRYDITLKTISGESGDANHRAADKWLRNTFPKICRGYGRHQIFNADETALFFKALLRKTLKKKGQKFRGRKLNKERISVLVCTNMSGTEKKKLVVIGKAKKPHCFKRGLKVDVHYRHSKKAWMVTPIWQEWLKIWDKEQIMKKERILLIVDNCSSHITLPKLKKIKVVFFPPKVTSLIQPLDQGIISNLKRLYRNYLAEGQVKQLDKWLRINEHETVEDFTPTPPDILQAIEWIHMSWEQVQPSTIQNCWKHSGLYFED